MAAWTLAVCAAESVDFRPAFSTTQSHGTVGVAEHGARLERLTMALEQGAVLLDHDDVNALIGGTAYHRVAEGDADDPSPTRG